MVRRPQTPEEETSKTQTIQYPRNVPANDLDLQMQVTDPAWQRLSPHLQEKLIKLVEEKIEGNKKISTYEQLHGILAIYTRDLRLANLSVWNGEYDYCSYYVELAVDLLEADMPQACIIALNKALARSELSSSKGGFLRKMFNTFRTESYQKALEPTKKSPFGGGKKGKEAI